MALFEVSSCHLLSEVLFWGQFCSHQFPVTKRTIPEARFTLFFNNSLIFRIDLTQGGCREGFRFPTQNTLNRTPGLSEKGNVQVIVLGVGFKCLSKYFESE